MSTNKKRVKEETKAGGQTIYVRNKIDNNDRKIDSNPSKISVGHIDTYQEQRVDAIINKD